MILHKESVQGCFLLCAFLVCVGLMFGLKAQPHAITVLGLQWGDEAKGSIVDALAGAPDVMVVRFNGGSNSGHTVNVDGAQFFLHSLPAGVVRPSAVNVIAAGCVLDVVSLFQEIEEQQGKGLSIAPDNLRISPYVPLLLPLHKEMDAWQEEKAGSSKIGSTKRGIAPAYMDKYARKAIRAGDLIGLEDTERVQCLRQKVGTLLAFHNAFRRGIDKEELDADSLWEMLLAYAPRLAPFITDVQADIRQALRAQRTVLFEGGQGAMLDIDFGTYPYVTSSCTTGLSLSQGVGLRVRDHYVLGVMKAYATRVGNGPFPTVLQGSLGEKLASCGQEVGVTTGRRRAVGWLDLVALKQVVDASGVDGLALTKVDVLDGFEEVKVCVGYQLNGQQLTRLPFSVRDCAALTPIYKVFNGWDKTARVRAYKSIDQNLKNFVGFVETFLDVPIVILSTGAERDHKIVRGNPVSGRWRQL